MYCYTYRDPNPSRSLGVLRTIPDFIEGFASEPDADIDGYIISTISSTEPLLSPAAKGRAADDFVFSGFTDEDRKRFRKEMLGTKPEDLLAQKEALRQMAESGCTCVVGPKNVLEGCEGLELFDL
jgi:Zn-dependent M16 (insulinase) family peptidase